MAVAFIVGVKFSEIRSKSRQEPTPFDANTSESAAHARNRPSISGLAAQALIPICHYVDHSTATRTVRSFAPYSW